MEPRWTSLGNGWRMSIACNCVLSELVVLAIILAYMIEDGDVYSSQ